MCDQIERAIRAAHEAGRVAGRSEARAEMERDALRLELEHQNEIAELRAQLATAREATAGFVSVDMPAVG